MVIPDIVVKIIVVSMIVAWFAFVAWCYYSMSKMTGSVFDCLNDFLLQARQENDPVKLLALRGKVSAYADKHCFKGSSYRATSIFAYITGKIEGIDAANKAAIKAIDSTFNK